MPRRNTKKETTNESKNEEVAPRRSGRSVTKVESATEKDAFRSRRSSTAAQTAASVAESKSPKNRGSTRRSSSPSDSRTRSNRESSESPATRVKSTRRSTSRINYKESDGEEETPTPKYDDNFKSGDEDEESDSDEKSKPSGKNVREVTRSRDAKEKLGSNTRGRRGRPSKKKTDESQSFVISDDSMEPEIVGTKDVKEIVGSKRTRGRKPKSEVIDVEPENETKPARRSSRAASNKEESPKKRPSRNVKTKRYTEEEEDDDIEEICDSKMKEVEGEKQMKTSHKRKRESSPEQSNKRVKETDEGNEMEVQNEKHSVADDAKQKHEKSDEEPMEVEVDSGIVSQEGSLAEEKDSTLKCFENKENIKDKQEEIIAESKVEPCDVKEVESTENIEECLENDKQNSPEALIFKSGDEDEDEKAASSDLEIINEIKETNNVTHEGFLQKEIEPATHKSEDSKPIIPIDCEQEQPVLPLNKDLEAEKDIESESDVADSQMCTNDINNSLKDDQIEEFGKADTKNINNSEIKTHAISETCDSSMNGEKELCNSEISVTITNSSKSDALSEDKSALKTNGAQDDIHLKSHKTDNSFLLPGRKYVRNSKLNENVLQSVNNQIFGFLSFNLGISMCEQKEKLLKELHDLDPHIICLQQVPKQFHFSVLEPSLDALGYKSVFSQPADSSKGIATFFKSTCFKLHSHSDISLKQLIDKELETSSLELTNKTAVNTYIKRCGNVMLTHFVSVFGSHSVVVVNVQIPPTDLSTHALQVSCLVREIIRINGGTNKPLLIGGEFNISENDASYQLLRDGYLANDMIDELQRRKDIAVPDKENSSLVDLLWKSFQHPSSNLCSCYSAVLDREISIPELKKTSPDLLWYSSDSLFTIGVVDVTSEKAGDNHFSLKADIAFAV